MADTDASSSLDAHEAATYVRGLGRLAHWLAPMHEPSCCSAFSLTEADGLDGSAAQRLAQCVYGDGIPFLFE